MDFSPDNVHGLLLYDFGASPCARRCRITLIEKALAENPALLAIRDQQQSAGHKVASADDLADPVVSFAFSNYPVDSFESDVTPMTGNELRLAQKLPYPGKLKTKQDVATQDALWFQGVFDDARLELTRQGTVVALGLSATITVFFVSRVTRALECCRRNRGSGVAPSTGRGGSRPQN